MCEVRPPVTLWGTTQIKTFTTILSTLASDQVSTITRETIVTNVIPVQTRSYPCTSSSTTSATSSTSFSPTPSPQSLPQPQPSSQAEEATSIQSVSSSPSPAPESLKVTREETDSLTVDLSPSRTLITTTSSTPTSIVPETVAPSPEPTKDPLPTTAPDPVLSTSSLFTNPDQSATTAGAAISSSSHANTALPVGAIVGIVLAALLIISLLGFFIWTRKHEKDRDSEGAGDPYWERRFQELESVQSQSKPRLDNVQNPDDTQRTWRRHVGLSHHRIE